MNERSFYYENKVSHRGFYGLLCRERVKSANSYIEYMRTRGKYTMYSDDRMKKTNYPEKRMDFGKKVSDITINNYIKKLKDI